MNENFQKIAISSRIRLARNFSGFNFFTKLRRETDAVFILNTVSNVLEKFGDFDISRLKNLSLNECNALLERHIISKELIENKDISAFALSGDEHLIVMVNEEDHIREQCIMNGFNLYRPFREIKKLDDFLLREIDVAYSEDYGFLTASPANLGTGMRASVMLFLPALERNNDINLIINEARAQGFTLRGIYGEGTENIGSLYQISNQNSLGLTEEEIVDGVSDYVYNICEMELSAREDILASNHDQLIDEVYRAYAVLKEGYLLNEKEMVELLSLVKFGDALGFLKILDMKKFDKLSIEGASANLRELNENFSNKIKENVLRSEYINKKISELVAK
ncbi:MAG: ATP--guanido phosphotransferase [Clostridiales bacterium]|nr:ATP--guanido phosphotransferase [Clostridiales bacterium]